MSLYPISLLLITTLVRSAPSRDCRSKRPAFLRRDGSYLETDLWTGLCLKELEELRASPLFPCNPTESRYAVDSLNLRPGGSNYCFRTTGYLSPPTTGYYRFAATGTLQAELWLSTTTSPGDEETTEGWRSDPAERRQLLRIDGDRSRRQSSFRVELRSEGRYFFEVVACAGEEDTLKITWLVPGSKDYSHIPSSALLHAPPSCSTLPRSYESSPSQQPALLSVEPAPSSLPLCTDISAPKSISDVGEVQVYPLDGTDTRNGENLVIGNSALSPEVSAELRGLLSTVLPHISSPKLSLYPNGLLWVEGPVSGTWLGYRSGALCRPASWLPSSAREVTLVVGVKGDNLANEVEQLVRGVAELQAFSTEYRVSLIIVDFNEGDMVRKTVEELSTPRVNVIKAPGLFDRGLAMAHGALNAPPRSLLFLLDLHIQMPQDLLQTAWTHTIRGRTAFAPATLRLNPAATPSQPDGSWDLGGFGLLSVYRSDFIRAGGLQRTPTFRWGGEDLEIIEKLLGVGVTVLRQRLPGLYHVHHSSSDFGNSLWISGR